MLRLDTTTSSLQAVLAGLVTTTQPQATVCFSDDVATAATYTGGKQVTVLNNVTDVTICAAPAASTVRDIDTVTIHNRDTVSITVTIKYDISGTDSTIVKATLLTLETLQYNHGDGWKVIDASGNIKTSASGIPTGAAGGDLSGTYPNPTVARINGVPLGSTVATSGNLLIADGTNWVSRTMSGDVTVNSTGVATIPAGSISLDELSDVVITSPATGATLIYDGVNWIDGALDLADNDARTGVLPAVNGGTGVTTSTGTGSTVLSASPTFTGTVTTAALITTGLFDISAAGAGQIKFPATQNPSADANTLDDYEEGTWTPADASGAGLTFTTPSGIYTKIGNIVILSGAVTYPVTASGAGTVISGAPFATNAAPSNQQGVLSYTNSSTAVRWIIGAGTSQGSFYTAAGAQVLNSQMSTNLADFQSFYRV